MIAALVAATLLTQPQPVTVTVTVESLALDVAALKTRPAVVIKVQEKGHEVAYKGVALREVLADKLKGPASMANLRALSDAVLVVRAADGYQICVSATAVAMDEAGTRYLLATERDGEPLEAEQGPFKLIVPGDPQHVRWIRGIEAVDLVRMPKPAKLKAPPARVPGP